MCILVSFDVRWQMILTIKLKIQVVWLENVFDISAIIEETQI